MSYFPAAGITDSIPAEEFADHVRQLHANDNYLYTEEYAVRYWVWLLLRGVATAKGML